MKSQRHKREENISIILFSNYSSGKKELHIPKAVFYGIFSIPLLLSAGLIVLAGLIFVKQNEINALRAQAEPYAQKIEELESKQADLSTENARLAGENAKLADENAMFLDEAAARAKEAENQYEGAPEGYPYMGNGGILLSAYSAEQPYMSINTHTDGEIVAAGDGIVTLIGSSDKYKYIVEITHDGGYITRYLCNKDVKTQLKEKTQVKTGDALFKIKVDNTQFDYQITFKNKPIDPIMVIEAKG